MQCDDTYEESSNSNEMTYTTEFNGNFKVVKMDYIDFSKLAKNL